MLKAVPLLAPLFGLLHGRRYTFKWAALLMLPYFTEGVVRSVSESGASARLALAETLLALLFFGTAVAYVRLTRPPEAEPVGRGTLTSAD